MLWKVFTTDVKPVLKKEKAVGGDESPTAIQDMETYECGTFPQSQNYLCDPLEAKNFAGNFLRAKARLYRLGKLGVFI
jgi:hypothetical protein